MDRLTDRKQRLDELCAWVLQHLHEPIGHQRLVEVSQMSHLGLHSVFQAYLRVTPMQWIRRERAIRLIEIPDELHRNPDS